MMRVGTRVKIVGRDPDRGSWGIDYFDRLVGCLGIIIEIWDTPRRCYRVRLTDRTLTHRDWLYTPSMIKPSGGFGDWYRGHK